MRSTEYLLLRFIPITIGIFNCKKNNLTLDESISFKNTCVNPQLLLMLLSICLQINGGCLAGISNCPYKWRESL